MSDNVIFSGNGEVTSGTFIRIIRQAVIAMERQADDAWIAQYAAAKLDGAALHWYEDLDDEIQESWRLLRRAILKQWPAVDSDPPGSTPAKVDTIPTPAAAAPAAPPRPTNNVSYPDVNSRQASSSSVNVASRITIPRLRIPYSEELRGKIEVLSRGGDHLGYVSHSLCKFGYHFTSQASNDALRVQLVFKSSYISIWADSNPRTWTDYTFLGLVWVGLGKGSWGCLMDATEAGSGRPVSSVTGQTDAKGIPPDYDVWSVLLDGTLVCTREESSGLRQPLIPIMNTNNKWILFGKTMADFLQDDNPKDFCEVRLRLETI